MCGLMVNAMINVKIVEKSLIKFNNWLKPFFLIYLV